ncbi:MAG: thioredoxin family protein [bacterium]|nr:thioredoxin family protein [bacterium]
MSSSARRSWKKSRPRRGCQGTGCAKCTKPCEATEVAANGLGLEYEIAKVTDLAQIMNYGVMMTPALVVDGEVKVAGRVPSADEIKKMLA